LQTIEGGLCYIDLFLAIEGFKNSCENQIRNAQLRRSTNTEPISTNEEALDNIREAAIAIYRLYLAPDVCLCVCVKVFILFLRRMREYNSMKH
jgi:hypothetical protein